MTFGPKRKGAFPFHHPKRDGCGRPAGRSFSGNAGRPFMPFVLARRCAKGSYRGPR